MRGGLVIVSGGSSGIGRALLETCPWPGARRIDLSRRGGAPGVEHMALDLADPAAWPLAAACFERELAAFGGARAVFFHNAGTLDPIGFAGEVESAAYTRNVLLNSAAPQVLGHAWLAAARRSRARCDLVMISSGAAHSPYAGWTGYCAGKAALDQWVRTAALEGLRRGRAGTILAVAPGIVETAMQQQIRATSEHDFPEVERFVELKTSGALRGPPEVARELWALLESDPESGSVLDLRRD